MKSFFLTVLFLIFTALTAVPQEKVVKSLPEIKTLLPYSVKMMDGKPGRITLNTATVALYREELYQEWAGSDWMNYFLIIQENDTAAKKLTTETKMWDNGWKSYQRAVFTYTGSFSDTTARLLSMVMSMYPDTAWSDFSITEWIYDQNNFLVEFRTSYIFGGVTAPAEKQVFENNSLGLPQVITVQSAEFGTGVLENVTRYTYQYNQSNQADLTSITEAAWENANWKDTSKILYTRNAKLNPLTIVYQNITGGNVIENMSRQEYVYYAGDELVNTMEYKFWSSFGSTWGNSSRESYTYNSNGDVLTYNYEIFIDNNYVPFSRETSAYDLAGLKLSNLRENYENGNWVNDDRTLYYYVPTTGVKEKETAVASYGLSQNYPNPFNPSTVIRYTLTNPVQITLKVYDALGKEVSTLVNAEQSAGEYRVAFDGSGLSSGIYYYTLTTPAGSVSKKMLLMK
ncbi:MAG: T9SS type A sorting domain-containing protein [Ignavibacteriaceae bacterium]|nr:T9SS type A sorting domain-containing protein [Ignavibacteriaceae bacterium]